MNADLSQAIQQFNLLGQAALNAQNAMGGAGGGLGGGGGGMGGGGGPQLVPGGGGGRGGGRGGPGSAPVNPLSVNRGGGGVGGGGSVGSPQSAWGGGITSSMFGLSQIGFAMEDYQYAGWRGAMNNVPWIAQAVGTLAGGPAVGQAALLATSIGIPLANAAWTGLNPDTQNRIQMGMFGGPGMSENELRSAQIDQMQQRLDSTAGGSYKRYDMERGLSEARKQEGLTQAGFSAMRTDYAQNAGMAERSGMSSNFFQSFGANGGFRGIDDSMRSSVTAFNAQDRSRASKLVASEYNSLSTGGQILSDAGSFLRTAGTAIMGGNDDTEQRILDGALERVKAEKVNWANDLAAEVEKVRRGEKPDWDKIMDLADRMGRDVFFQMRTFKREYERAEDNAQATKIDNYNASQVSPTERAARSEGGDLFVGPMQKKVFDAKELEKLQNTAANDTANMMAEQKKIQGEAARTGGIHESQLSAIARGSKTGAEAGEKMEQYLANRGVSQEQINTLVTPQLIEGVQNSKDDRKNSDEQLWDKYSAQWIQTVKSDILQAQRASFGRGGFNQKTFNGYLSRIKTKIRDDLGSAGISRYKREDYAKMIWDAAYEEAQLAYGDANTMAKNQIGAAGMSAANNPGAVNQMTMQNLMGQMGDDLNAVYGNAQANNFFVQRQMNASFRRQQIRLNRFAR